jgi:excisionase family DNA binding protein
MNRDDLIGGEPRQGFDLLTAQEVARELRVHVDRVYEAVRGGRLQAHRVGRRLRFRREQVDAFLEGCLT